MGIREKGNGRKWNNVPTDVDGRRFSSKKEARTYKALRALEGAGKLRDLKCQVVFKLVVNGELITTYRADFTYFDTSLKQHVVADAKGHRHREYLIKKRLMKALHNIEILEL